MVGGGAEISLGRAGESALSVLGAYLDFDHTASLQPQIRRQNTRVAGLIVHDYQVFDIVARLTRGGQVPMQLVVDYCWNTAVDADNKGLWLAARARRDRRLAGAPRVHLRQGGQGRDAGRVQHRRLLLGHGLGRPPRRPRRLDRRQASIHGIGQLQRFKDSPDPLERDQWVTRYRLEWRIRF